MSIDEYRPHIVEAIRRDPKRFDLASLVNTTLGCWCKPLSCHGDEIVELVAEMVMALNGDQYHAEFRSIISA